jgi:serine phosphatase RsbU (regulator of sigma subunit)
MHQYAEARKSLDSAGSIFKKINSKPGLEQIYAAFVKLDSASLNYKYAFEHSRLYMIYHDSLFNEENTKKAVRAEMNFDFDKKQAVDKAERIETAALAAAESKRQRIILISVSAMLFLILGFAVYAYRNYRLKLYSNIRLEIQKKNIEDSITYARRIQEAIFPKQLFEAGEVEDHVLFYRPRDIVSGDFYWRFRDGEELFIAVVDCTGHGVPGAIMSMLGYDLMESAVKDKGLREPAEILNLLNRQIIEKLKSGNGHSASDGMDITLCRINLNTHNLVYAGAGNDLIVYTGKKMEVLAARSISIGYSDSHTYTQHSKSLQPADMIWLFTDGYRDQNGGPENKKIRNNGWKSLLLELSPLPCSEQQSRLTAFFENWKGYQIQRDDVLVLGIRL